MSTRPHSSLREGVILGAVVGTGIWVWIRAGGRRRGEPFHTFALLGGVGRFTTLHFVLCLTYGVVAVSVVHAAAREASLMVGAAFAFFLLEFAFVMLTAILSQGEPRRARLGPDPWRERGGGRPHTPDSLATASTGPGVPGWDGRGGRVTLGHSTP